MDDEFIITIVTLFLILIIIGIVFIPIGISANNSAVASENAMSLCKQMGFETYIDYNRKYFGKEPYGLLCGSYKERMINEHKIKAYETNGEEIQLLEGNVNNGGL